MSNKLIKMNDSVLIKPKGILEVNPDQAKKASSACVVEVFAKAQYDWATKYLVYGAVSSEKAINAVLKHSRVVSSAYSAGGIDFGVIVVEDKEISNITAMDEMKEHYYPIIIKA